MGQEGFITRTMRIPVALLTQIDQYADTSGRSRNNAIEHLVRVGLAVEAVQATRNPLSPMFTGTTDPPTDGEGND